LPGGKLGGGKLLRLICWVLLLGVLTVFPCAVTAEVPNWQRGPIGIRDPFPLGLLVPSFVAQSPEVLPRHGLSLKTSLLWSNTINRKSGGYLIDSETRVLGFLLKGSPTENLELSIDLPLVWRGGGVLDGPIFSWHKTFGLSQGPRDDDDIDHDQYLIEGLTRDDESFQLNRQGTHFGDLTLGAKYLVSKGNQFVPAVSLVASVQLPTGADTYGLNGLGLSAGLLASKSWGRWALYQGVNYSYLVDPKVESLRFERHRAAGFVSAEYALDYLSAHLALSAASNLLDNVQRFPEYQTYLDFGLTFPLSDRIELQLLLRENPAPGKGTADFSMYAALDCDVY